MAKVKKAGTAISKSAQSIFLIPSTIRTPTTIRAGAVATAGTTPMKRLLVALLLAAIPFAHAESPAADPADLADLANGIWQQRMGFAGAHF